MTTEEPGTFAGFGAHTAEPRGTLAMMTLGIAIFAAAAVVAGIQAVLSLRLIAAFHRPRSPLLADGECPPVVAVLCLRGCDPFLSQTLHQLFFQDYPNYTVRIVIDSATDPAWPLVEAAICDTGVEHVAVAVLQQRRELCSAKMSSLLQASDDLPADCAVVATFDGDAVLHPSCLRELVTPIVRDGVPVASGNRWFAPQTLTPGALGRLEWNAASVPLMHSMQLPWGGCLAMTRDVISDSLLRERFAHAFAEDMLLGDFLRQSGRRVRFVPEATIVNRESLSLKELFHFLTRQMLCVRLHHQQWKRIVAYGSLLSALGTVICPLGLWIPGLRGWCLASLGLLVSVLLVTMTLQGRAVRRLIAPRGERLIPVTPLVLVLMALTTPLTQLVTLLANLLAVVAPPTTWRGLTYRFGRNPRVQLIAVGPAPAPAHEPLSIAAAPVPAERIAMSPTVAEESVAS